MVLSIGAAVIGVRFLFLGGRPLRAGVPEAIFLLTFGVAFIFGVVTASASDTIASVNVANDFLLGRPLFRTGLCSSSPFNGIVIVVVLLS